MTQVRYIYLIKDIVMKNFCKHIAMMVIAIVLSPFHAYAIVEHGDVNNDRVISINDVTSLIDHLLMDYISAVDDINGDAMVNIDDVTALIDYLLKGDGEWQWAYTGPAFPDSALVFDVNGVQFAMIPVEGGSFRRLSIVPEVTLGDYYMAQTEVTKALWEAVMETAAPQPVYYCGSPWEPVSLTTWWECQEFITRLNELTGQDFHLPTFDQWIYAASGGKQTHGYTYAGSNEIDEVAWYYGNLPAIFSGPLPVGMKAPNELGLYDMCGNAREWVYNDVSEYGDELIPLDDPMHDITHKYMIGGNFDCNADNCRIMSWYPTTSSALNMCGLRLALGPDLSND